MSPRISILAPLVCLATLAAPAASAASDDLRIEVGKGKGPLATVEGHGTSLRAALEELCWQSNVGLRYDAADEAFGAAIREQPLEDVLARLLRSHSYVLTMHAAPSGSARITGLHVLGGEGPRNRQVGPPSAPPAASPSAPSPPPATQPAQLLVPVARLQAAFAEQDPERRSAAVRELVTEVRSSPERYQAFLAGDPMLMSAALRPFPDAVAVLREMKTLSDLDDSARAKLDALITALQ